MPTGKTSKLPPLVIGSIDSVTYKTILMAYSNFKVEDFITDEYFIKWVKTPSEESNAFWSSWISTHPQQKATFQKAREIILLLEIKENRAPEGKFLEIWENIAQASDDKTVRMSVNKDNMILRHAGRTYQWFIKTAAAVAFFCLIIWAYSLYYDSRSIVITTSYGESRTLFLPDSTKVTLNANSILSYAPNDFTENHREVSLQGQAFFAVVHKSGNQNFKVHTSALQVEVLGTRFDVNSRRGKTKVILEEGRVRLDVDRESKKPETLVMKPGDFVEVSEYTKEIKRKTVDPQEYLSWRNNRLEFVSSSLQEIGQLIEDNYGYKVIFSDAELKERKFTGSSSSEDIQELLQKLSKLFDLNIKQEGREIIIQAK